MHLPATPVGRGATFSTFGVTAMTWTPPQAQDFRFGFEINLYVTAR